MTRFLGSPEHSGVNPADSGGGRYLGRHRRSARSQFAAVRPGRVHTLRDQFAAV